jgi:hypothetical protein
MKPGGITSTAGMWWCRQTLRAKHVAVCEAHHYLGSQVVSQALVLEKSAQGDTVPTGGTMASAQGNTANTNDQRKAGGRSCVAKWQGCGGAGSHCL